MLCVLWCVCLLLLMKLCGGCCGRVIRSFMIWCWVMWCLWWFGCVWWIWLSWCLCLVCLMCLVCWLGLCIWFIIVCVGLKGCIVICRICIWCLMCVGKVLVVCWLRLCMNGFVKLVWVVCIGLCMRLIWLCVCCMISLWIMLVLFSIGMIWRSNVVVLMVDV